MSFTAHTPHPQAVPSLVHPFAGNGEQLLQRHARQCAHPGGWRQQAHDALYSVHGFFAHRFATSVLAGTVVVLCAMAVI